MADINNVIAEASQDLQTIEDFVNLPADSEVYPRLLPSVNVGTLAGTRQAIFEAGGLPAKPFATKALMTASSLANDKYAMVTDDTANNGLYVKTAGTWVKSTYEPVSKAYADANPFFKPVDLVASQDLLSLSAGIYKIRTPTIGNTIVNMPPMPTKLGVVEVKDSGLYKSIVIYPYGRDTAFYINSNYELGVWSGWQTFSSDQVVFNTVSDAYASKVQLASSVAAALDSVTQSDFYGKQYNESQMQGDRLYTSGTYVGFNGITTDAAPFNAMKARVFNTDSGDIEYRVYIGDAVSDGVNGYRVISLNMANYSYEGVCKSFPRTDSGAAQRIDFDKVIAIPANTAFVIVFKNTNLAKFGIAASTLQNGLPPRSFSLATTATDWGDTTQISNASTTNGYYQTGFNLIIELAAKSNGGEAVPNYTPTLVMPPKIYAMSGLQAHIYPEHLLPEPQDLYLHDVTCALGKQTVRGWEYDVPAGQGASTTALSWSVHDKQTAKLLNSASTSLVIADSAKAGSKKVLVIGDSYVNAGAITQRLLDISATDALKTTLIGTRGADVNKHEGRGGWKVSDYATAGRTYYQFTVSGVTTVPAINSTVYTFGGGTFVVQEIAISAGAGTITCSFSSGTAPTNGSTGTLTKSSGAGDTTIVFSNVQSLSGNPFWFSGAINFGQYLSTNSLSTPDVVLIQLGVNDSFGATTDADVEAIAATAFAQIDTLITSIKASNAAVKIGIISPPAYANQDGFGYDYGCGQTAWRAKRNIVAWNKKLYAYFAGKEAQNVYVVAAGLNVDTENNFPTITQAINSQNSNMITVQKGGVHPADSGYKQIGDAMFAFIKAVA